MARVAAVIGVAVAVGLAEVAADSEDSEVVGLEAVAPAAVGDRTRKKGR